VQIQTTSLSILKVAATKQQKLIDHILLSGASCSEVAVDNVCCGLHHHLLGLKRSQRAREERVTPALQRLQLLKGRGSDGVSVELRKVVPAVGAAAATATASTRVAQLHARGQWMLRQVQRQSCYLQKCDGSHNA
jgi:hypothetical protein